MKLFGSAALLLIPISSLLAAGTTIDNITPWNGTQFISAFGIPNTQTYGQTITVPSGVGKLSSFSVEMRFPTTLAFRGEIFAWDGTKATGSSLYESPVTSTSDSSTFQLITFNTGGVSLTPGQTYVLFISSSQDNSGHSGTGQWGATADSSFAGGSFVFLNNGSDNTKWTTSTWSTLPFDAAFQASFDPPAPTSSAAPMSPVTLLLTFVGLAGAGAYHAKYRMQQRFQSRS